MAFRIAADLWQDTIAYLRAREQVTMVYLERLKRIRLLTSGQDVEAVTYVVDRKHRQYAGRMEEEAVLGHIRQGQGVSGACTEYVFNTVAHLRDMNIHDDHLERLTRRLRT